ncbi:MAG: cysteine desulfurase [Ruaniaceae bacterium]|nr:cysteine desulfurase [Ruaniaceae bacterium]
MIYLDHASTTPVRPEALEAFLRACEVGGNASSIHATGRAARRVLEEARESIAATLGAEPAEVIFTSGGTEAANLAGFGAGRAVRALDKKASVAVSSIEHPAVLEAARAVGKRLQILQVDSDSQLRVEALGALPPETGLISVMWVNNETGMVQPLDAVVAAGHAYGALVHSDAVQAVGHVPVSFRDSGLDLLSFSGHKIGAPVGIGALIAKRGVQLAKTSYGGDQERGVRSGTLNVAGAAALAVACAAAVSSREAEAERLRALRRIAEDSLVAIDGVRVTGVGLEKSQRSPAIVHAVVEGVDADSLQFALDRAGIATSSGSACRAGVQEASYVIEAMGLPWVRGGLRCSLGWTSEAEDVEVFSAHIAGAIAAARAAHN